jgi:crotonobetainyl-CoA:carnitine CoA-transferase CaiB-like acyl-CoA transferase
MHLTAGVITALVAARTTGQGRVVSASIADSDLRYVAVGALERKFHIALLEKLDLLGQIDPEHQHDRQTRSRTARLLEQVFASRTRDAWSDVFAPRPGARQTLPHHWRMRLHVSYLPPSCTFFSTAKSSGTVTRPIGRLPIHG